MNCSNLILNISAQPSNAYGLCSTCSLKEVAESIGDAAKNGPGLVRVAKNTLSDKQARIDELEAAVNKRSTEYTVYAEFYKGQPSVSACDKLVPCTFHRSVSVSQV